MALKLMETVGVQRWRKRGPINGLRMIGVLTDTGGVLDGVTRPGRSLE